MVHNSEMVIYLLHISVRLLLKKRASSSVKGGVCLGFFSALWAVPILKVFKCMEDHVMMFLNVVFFEKCLQNLEVNLFPLKIVRMVVGVRMVVVEIDPSVFKLFLNVGKIMCIYIFFPFFLSTSLIFHFNCWNVYMFFINSTELSPVVISLFLHKRREKYPCHAESRKKYASVEIVNAFQSTLTPLWEHLLKKTPITLTMQWAPPWTHFI